MRIKELAIINETKTAYLTVSGRGLLIEGKSCDPYLDDVEAQFAGLGTMATAARLSVPPGGIILDVGANVGLSVIALSLAVPGARIVAFEPSAENRKFLESNIRANAIENVTVVSKAVSDRPGELLFQEAASGSASHVFSGNHIGAGAGAVSIQKTTLDEAVCGLDAPVSFIKIDVEGHEPNVLAGARRTILRDNPIIFMEFNSWCLSAMGGHNPATFARAIWDHFSVLELSADVLSETAISPFGFLHRNLTQHGCVDDVILRHRQEAAFPSLEQLSWPKEALTLLTPDGTPIEISKMAEYSKAAPH